jgi:hypothetical protein
MAAAVQTGMARSCGDIVFVQEEQTDISTADIRRLWEMRNDDKLIMARAQPEPKPASGLMERLTRWAAALQESAQQQQTGGIQMIRRQGIEDLRRSHTPEEMLAITQFPNTQIARSDGSHIGPTKAPGFLRKLRDLAVGE